MRILLVYCHPVETSFCAAVRDAALAGLRDAGHEIRLTDLYAEDFDPRLTREGRLNYHNPALNTLPVAGHVANIQWAEGLVFVFPVWNQGMPAMLKGWFDRVWLPEITFTLKKGGLVQFRPKLTNIRLMAGVVTCGSPWWLTLWSGNTARNALLRGIGTQCGPRCRKMWLAHYRIDSATPASRAAYLAKVKARMAGV